jgi:hypothetical protein
MYDSDRFEEELPNGWDEHFCFNIVDFTPGSQVMALHLGRRESGIVVSTDQNYLSVTYRCKDGTRRTVNINSVVYLD